MGDGRMQIMTGPRRRTRFLLGAIGLAAAVAGPAGAAERAVVLEHWTNFR